MVRDFWVEFDRLAVTVYFLFLYIFVPLALCVLARVATFAHFARKFDESYIIVGQFEYGHFLI